MSDIYNIPEYMLLTINCFYIINGSKRSFGTTALPAGCSPMGLRPGPDRAPPILNDLKNQ